MRDNRNYYIYAQKSPTESSYKWTLRMINKGFIVWKTVNEPLYGKYYLVSTTGAVRSKPRTIIFKSHNQWKTMTCHKKYNSQLLTPQKTYKNYLTVDLHAPNVRSKHFFIHRLVLLTFKPNPNHYSDVNHINEKREDNRLCNLQWLSHKRNINYRNHNKKLSISESSRTIGLKSMTNSIYIYFPRARQCAYFLHKKEHHGQTLHGVQSYLYQQVKHPYKNRHFIYGYKCFTY